MNRGSIVCLFLTLLVCAQHLTHSKIVAVGENIEGQIGDGTGVSSIELIDVTSSSSLLTTSMSVLSFATGDDFVVLVTSENEVYSWGHNGHGQLAIGNTTTKLSPVNATGTGVMIGLKVVAVAAGDEFGLGLGSGGEVFGWGLNSHGQVGDGTTTTRESPVDVTTPQSALNGVNVTQIYCGGYHSMAISNSGKVYTWGDNTYGQLGNNTYTDGYEPVDISSMGALSGETAKFGDCGEYFCVVVTNSNKVLSWGRNNVGQLGTGDFTQKIIPTDISSSGTLSGKTIRKVSCGDYFCLALASDGSVSAWGGNTHGQIGDGTRLTRKTPQLVNSGEASGVTFTNLCAGWHHALGTTSTSLNLGWGLNDYGQIGDISNVQRYSPVSVYPDWTITHLGCGKGFSSVVTEGADGSGLSGTNDVSETVSAGSLLQPSFLLLLLFVLTLIFFC